MTKISADSDDAVVASKKQSVNDATGVAAEAGSSADTEAAVTEAPQQPDDSGDVVTSNVDSEPPTDDMEPEQSPSADVLSSKDSEQVTDDSTAVTDGSATDTAPTDGQSAVSAETS